MDLSNNYSKTKKTFPIIEFENVHFKYPGQKNKTITNLSFCINKGEHVSIGGKPKSGKTTLLKLLCGYYKPDSGKILVNGVEPYFDHYKKLYQQISYVPQKLMDLQVNYKRNKWCLALENLMDANKIESTIDCCRSKKHTPLNFKDPNKFIGNWDKEWEVLNPNEVFKKVMQRAIYANRDILVLDEAFDLINKSIDQEKIRHIWVGRTVIFTRNYKQKHPPLAPNSKNNQFINSSELKPQYSSLLIKNDGFETPVL